MYLNMQEKVSDLCICVYIYIYILDAVATYSAMYTFVSVKRLYEEPHTCSEAISSAVKIQSCCVNVYAMCLGLHIHPPVRTDTGSSLFTNVYFTVESVSSIDSPIQLVHVLYTCAMRKCSPTKRLS